MILTLLSVACTQKYTDYDIVLKTDFLKNAANRPISERFLPGRADKLGQCFNQWLFFSNAENQKKEYLPNIVQALCPGDEYLVNATVTERWWTVIFFSQACVKIETFCPVRSPKQ